MWNTAKIGSAFLGRRQSRTIQLIDELFLFLCRLRVGLLTTDLAVRFSISKASVSRKIVTWANFLYFVLGLQPISPTLEQIQQSMPLDFKALYPSTVMIVDCTEIEIERPSSMLLQSQVYSTYKSRPTVKGLFGIAPCGAVTFVSSLFTGSISDKEITKQCGLCQLLQQTFNEAEVQQHSLSIMADKGFLVKEMLNAVGFQLNMPPFLKTAHQFSEFESRETKKIARVRIHVERAIKRVKEYHP